MRSFKNLILSVPRSAIAASQLCWFFSHILCYQLFLLKKPCLQLIQTSGPVFQPVQFSHGSREETADGNQQLCLAYRANATIFPIIKGKFKIMETIYLFIHKNNIIFFWLLKNLFTTLFTYHVIVHSAGMSQDHSLAFNFYQLLHTTSK